MFERGLLRAVKWARNPPSKSRVYLFLIILAICVGLWAFEQFFGWPDALTVERLPRRVPIN